MQIEAMSNNGTTPDGVLIRAERVEPDGTLAIDSLVVMRPQPDILMRFRQRVEYQRTIRDCHYWESTLEPGGHKRQFTRDQLPRGLSLPLVPSFARYLLVLELASMPGDWLEYFQVDENDPAEPKHAMLVRTPLQPSEAPDDTRSDAFRIDLLIEGVPATAYWCDDKGVVSGDFVQHSPPPIGRVAGLWWRTTWEDVAPWLDAEARAAVEASGLLE